VWDHASNSLVEDTARSTEMEGATSGGVEAGDLSKVGMVLDCRVRIPLAISSEMRQRHRVPVMASVLI
jgi:hypothetical protein